MSTPTTTREVHLAARPHGEPVPSDFEIVETEIPELAEGQVLVANDWMSVDPYMRTRMNAGESYMPAYEIGEPMEGEGFGTVVASRSAELPVGTSVVHRLGWREHSVGDASAFMAVDPALAPPSAFLGVLGVPGLTAYTGLLTVAQMKEGDVVYVSAAAGAVGSAVGQIAKLKGASRVIGSAGSEEKVARLKELGFDAAFNYKDGPVEEQLREAAPEGIDVYFDNVGGEHLEAALAVINQFGRIAMCGAISIYNATEEPVGPRNISLVVSKSLRLRGFIVSEFLDQFPALYQEVGAWAAQGKIFWDETVRDGLDEAPQALIDLLNGANLGKMVVKLS